MTVSPTPSVTVSASPQSPAPAGSTPRCVGTQLVVRFVEVQGASGDSVARFKVINAASVTCHLQGFPGFTLKGKGVADEVAVRSSASHSSYIPVPFTPRLVTLAPGGYAEFGVEASDSDVTHGGAPWPKSISATVYAPGDTTPLTVRVEMPMPQEPNPLTISPVEPPGCIPNPNCS